MVLFATWRLVVTVLFASAVYLCLTWSRSELNSPIIKFFSVCLLALLINYSRTCLFNNWVSSLDKRGGNSKNFRGFYLETFFVISTALFTATIFTTLLLYSDKLQQAVTKSQEARREILQIRSDKQFEKLLFEKRGLLSAIQEFEYRLSGGALPIIEQKFKLRRKALIVGNSDYKFEYPLKGVANDINKISSVLADAGYAVTLIRNQSREDTERGVQKFAEAITEDDIIVFYIAGHGYSLAGRNMLADISYDGRKTRADRGHHIESWLDKVLNRKPKFGFFVLDACRETKVEDSFIQKLKVEQDRQSFDPIIFKTYSPPPGVPFVLMQSARAGQYVNDDIGDCIIGSSCSRDKRLSPFASEFSSHFKVDTPITIMIKNMEKGLTERISAVRKNPPPDISPELIEDQDIEVRSSSGGLVIRHISPDSKLATRREKLQDNVLFDELKSCKGIGTRTLSCLERERERLRVEISLLETSASEIRSVNAAVLDYAIKNSGDISVFIRESARHIAFIPIMLIITLILSVDMVMLILGYRLKKAKVDGKYNSSSINKIKNNFMFIYNALILYRRFSTLQAKRGPH